MYIVESFISLLRRTFFTPLGALILRLNEDYIVKQKPPARLQTTTSSPPVERKSTIYVSKGCDDYKTKDKRVYSLVAELPPPESGLNIKVLDKFNSSTFYQQLVHNWPLSQLTILFVLCIVIIIWKKSNKGRRSKWKGSSKRHNKLTLVPYTQPKVLDSPLTDNITIKSKVVGFSWNIPIEVIESSQAALVEGSPNIVQVQSSAESFLKKSKQESLVDLYRFEEPQSALSLASCCSLLGGREFKMTKPTKKLLFGAYSPECYLEEIYGRFPHLESSEDELNDLFEDILSLLELSKSEINDSIEMEFTEVNEGNSKELHIKLRKILQYQYNGGNEKVSYTINVYLKIFESSLPTYLNTLHTRKRNLNTKRLLLLICDYFSYSTNNPNMDHFNSYVQSLFEYCKIGLLRKLATKAACISFAALNPSMLEDTLLVLVKQSFTNDQNVHQIISLGCIKYYLCVNKDSLIDNDCIIDLLIQILDIMLSSPPNPSKIVGPSLLIEAIDTYLVILEIFTGMSLVINERLTTLKSKLECLLQVNSKLVLNLEE